MNLKKIYFSSEGRLSRAQFFWYLVLAGVIMTIITAILAVIISFATMYIVGPSAVILDSTNTIGVIIGGIIDIVVNMMFLFFCYKHLVFKREHDRGQDGKNTVKFILIVFSIIYVLSFGINMLPITPMITYIPILNYITWFFGVIGLILVRPLLFRIGITGSNKYGPDPLEKKKK